MSVRAFSLAAAVLGMSVALLTGTLAIMMPGWGGPLMELAAAVGPWVTGANWPSVFLMTLYMGMDGLLFGGLFAWLYNWFSKSNG